MARGIVTERPWGRFTTYVTNADDVTVKVIAIDPGHRLSLQYHSKRSETWICIQGEAVAEIGDEKHTLRPGQEVTVPVGARHRLGAGPLGAQILEIAHGDFSEDDIVRIEDDYRRS